MQITTMTVEFDNLTVKIKNPQIQDKIKALIMGAKEQNVKHNKYWAPEDDETLKTLLKDGKQPRHIAPIMGRTAAAISARIYAKGFKVAEEQKQTINL